MYCLRCGREIEEKQVFCHSCLQDMARHPVKPDAAVYIPSRNSKEIPKRQHRQKKKASPEEMVHLLKKRIKRLWITITILFLLLVCFGAGIYFAWWHDPNLNLGQNFQTVDSVNSSTGNPAITSSGD